MRRRERSHELIQESNTHSSTSNSLQSTERILQVHFQVRNSDVPNIKITVAESSLGVLKWTL